MRWFVLSLLLLPVAAPAAPPLATRTLPAGTIISPEDLTEGDPDENAGMVGLATRVMIYSGKPVQLTQLTAPKLIERNQLVTLVYENALLRIEAEGRALAAGSVGEIVRVMNLSSRTTLAGRVQPDGTILVEQR
ncbi:flagellar basal body P-ring formation chaperone FlgA [Paracoccus aminophilus]|uniref:Flagella basal body P-ring formation protein FlgA n=1 Tax=Paracoccus aminophilus JCM 7686 TaxID=1367847 RepID=S5Y308_PARAH|nr:flagellar basal body P-ring formation chaperone FlgA [Paracoccus aminophilus]AGT10130.1 flagellar basal body P-ring biosynthesis protein FlgA [Paracoccus aminophilus JCM 7686]